MYKKAKGEMSINNIGTNVIIYLLYQKNSSALFKNSKLMQYLL